MLHEARDAKHWLRGVTYSGDGEAFAVASQDGGVYLYDARSLNLKAKADKLSGPAHRSLFHPHPLPSHTRHARAHAPSLSRARLSSSTLAPPPPPNSLSAKKSSQTSGRGRVDFSEDGAYIQAESQYEHLFFSAGDGQHFRLPSQLKNVAWGDWTSRMGWPVQGLWGVGHGEPAAVHKSKAGDMLAAGFEVRAKRGFDWFVTLRPLLGRGHSFFVFFLESFIYISQVWDHRSSTTTITTTTTLFSQDGCVVVCRYPSLDRRAPRLEVEAHAGPVASVRFTCDGKYLLTLGRRDKVVMVWRLGRNQLSTQATPGGWASSEQRRIPSAGGRGRGNEAQVANGLMGARVEMHGLTARSDLNGKIGYVTAYRAEPTRRYTVRVDGVDYNLKAGHVRKTAPEHQTSKKEAAPPSENWEERPE